MAMLVDALRKGASSYCDPTTLFAALLTHRRALEGDVPDARAMLQEALHISLRRASGMYGIPLDFIADVCSGQSVFTGGLLYKAIWGHAVDWPDRLLSATFLTPRSETTRIHNRLIDVGFALRSPATAWNDLLTRNRHGGATTNEDLALPRAGRTRELIDGIVMYTRGLTDGSNATIHMVVVADNSNPKDALQFCDLRACSSYFDRRGFRVTDPSDSFRLLSKLEPMRQAFVCAFAESFTQALQHGTHTSSFDALPEIWPEAVRVAAEASFRDGLEMDRFPIDRFSDLLQTMERFHKGSMPQTLPGSRKLFRWLRNFVRRCAEYERAGIRLQPPGPCDNCTTWYAFDNVLLAFENAARTMSRVHLLPPGNTMSAYEAAARRFHRNEFVLMREMTLRHYAAALHMAAKAPELVAQVCIHWLTNGSASHESRSAAAMQMFVAPAYEKVLETLWPRAVIKHYGICDGMGWDAAIRCPFLAEALAQKYGSGSFANCTEDYDEEVVVAFFYNGARQ